jgi:hypothetical protein
MVESPISVLAMCAGEIPAAVAVAARDLQELISLSLEVVRVQFRFYHQVVERTIHVDEEEGNWGATLTGTTQEFVQEILDDFHDFEVNTSRNGLQIVNTDITMSSKYRMSDGSVLGSSQRAGLPWLAVRRRWRVYSNGLMSWMGYLVSTSLDVGLSTCPISPSQTWTPSWGYLESSTLSSVAKRD